MSDATAYRVTCGDLELTLRAESALAPGAVDALNGILPLSGTVRHGKWSGEAFWLPLDAPIDTPLENLTSYPAAGDVLLYRGDPAGVPELLFTYGAAHFRGKTGSMSAIHVLTAISGLETLREIGRRTDWHGGQPLTIERLT